MDVLGHSRTRIVTIPELEERHQSSRPGYQAIRLP
jgi:hypothetical protein